MLSPILFLIFIINVTNVLTPDAKAKLFADDLKSYVRIANDSDASVFTAMLGKISDWAHTWQLPLSTSKCCYMIIYNRCGSIPQSFTLNEAELEKVSEVKGLGILFSNSTNFTNHISSIIGKAKQRLFLIQKSFVSCDSAALIKAYKIYVRPLLEYCSQVWSPHHITDIARIESLQRAFTKRLIDFEGLSYAERLIKASLPTLELRRLRADLVLCFKILNGFVEISPYSFFVLDPDSRTRGHPLKLKLKPARLDSRFYFYSLRTAAVWNSLSANTISSVSLNSFKTNLRSEKFTHFLKVVV